MKRKTALLTTTRPFKRKHAQLPFDLIQQIFSYVNTETIETFIKKSNGQRKVFDMTKLTWQRLDGLVIMAVEYGHMDILMYCSQRGCYFNEFHTSTAASYGQLEVLKWLRSRDPPCPWNTWTLWHASEEGHLDILKYAHENKCPRNLIAPCDGMQLVFSQAVLGYRENTDNSQSSLITPAAASFNGHLEIVQYLHQNGYPWFANTPAMAAKHGHLEIIKWVRSVDPPCPWDERTPLFATINGHLETLKWVRSRKPPCPWNFEEVKKEALVGQHHHILHYLESIE